MKFLFSLTIMLMAASATGQGIEKIQNPVELREVVDSAVPKEIEGLQWNRWTSKNFVVLSTTDAYAEYLNQHLELVKTWILARWGFFDIDFSVPCKVICVDDPTLFARLFKIKETKVEVRKDSQGKIKETIIFLLANDTPSRALPAPLTEVIVAEFGEKYDSKFGWWTYRGMAILNGSVGQIRRSIASINSHIETNDYLYFSQGLMETTQEEYMKLSKDDQNLYDSSAALLCLMIRKEFGQDKFHQFLKESVSSPAQAFKKVLGFKSFDDFDKRFKKYMSDLSRDVTENKTPDLYLQIYEPEN